MEGGNKNTSPSLFSSFPSSLCVLEFRIGSLEVDEDEHTYGSM